MLITNAFNKYHKYWLRKSFCFRALPSCSVYTVMLFFGHRSTLVLYFMFFACPTNPFWFPGKHGLVSANAHVFLLKSRLMPSFYAFCRPLTRYSASHKVFCPLWKPLVGVGLTVNEDICSSWTHSAWCTNEPFCVKQNIMFTRTNFGEAVVEYKNI